MPTQLEGAKKPSFFAFSKDLLAEDNNVVLRLKFRLRGMKITKEEKDEQVARKDGSDQS